MSASAWQGCSSLESALITASSGVACVISRRRSCPNVRIDHGVHPAFEVSRDVIQRLAIGVHHVRRDLDDVSAELAHANREGHAGPQRGLLEQQAHVPAGQGLSGGRGLPLLAIGLDPDAQLQGGPELRRSEIEDGQEVARHVWLSLSA